VISPASITGAARRGLDHAGIAHLPPGFGVKRRLVDHDLNDPALDRTLRRCSLLHQRQDLGLGALGVIAEEFGRPLLLGDVEPDRLICGLSRTDPGRTRLGLLRGHGFVEPVDIDASPLLAQGVLRKIEREAIGIVELEGRGTG
jgi:hypothetical protein